MLSASQTWPYVVATLLLLLIASAEGLALLAGGSLFHWLDNLVPEDLLPDDPAGDMGFLEKGLGWLHVGRVPMLVILVTFLAAFSIIGFALNMLTYHVASVWLPVALSSPLAVLAALPVVRGVADGMARLIPQDQSYAVTLGSLVGRVATVMTGRARRGFPAQAKVSSQHGQTLYVMVEPEEEDALFEAGTSVLLVRQISGRRFAGIPNPRPDLL